MSPRLLVHVLYIARDNIISRCVNVLFLFGCFFRVIFAAEAIASIVWCDQKYYSEKYPLDPGIFGKERHYFNLSQKEL